MINILSFLTIADLVANQSLQTAQVGELSRFSETFAKDKAEYQSAQVPGYKLTVFKSIDISNGNYNVLDVIKVAEIMTVARSIMSYVNGHARSYDSSDFLETIVANNTGVIRNFRHGERVDNGNISCPEWFSWDSVNKGYSIKIWMSDSAFQAQYEDSQIVVIPPLTPLDNFFNFYSTVATALDNIAPDTLDRMIEQFRDHQPESYLRLLQFEFVNKNNVSQTKKVVWPVLIYGAAGDNPDSIKDAIVDYVLANSSHTKAEWEVIFPSIFKRTEFIIIPRWDKISIPNLTNLSALYGNHLDPAECLDFAVAHTPFYPEAHVRANTTIMPYDYKAINMLIVGGNNNVDGKKKITDLYPDYIPVNTSSLDYNRMSMNTRSWGLKLEEMLIEAERINEYSSIRHGLRRVTRNNIVYVSALINNVNFLMAAKYNAFFTV